MKELDFLTSNIDNTYFEYYHLKTLGTFKAFYVLMKEVMIMTLTVSKIIRVNDFRCFLFQRSGLLDARFIKSSDKVMYEE